MGVFWGRYAIILKKVEDMRATILKSLLDPIVLF